MSTPHLPAGRPCLPHPGLQPPSYKLAQHGDGERETFIQPLQP